MHIHFAFSDDALGLGISEVYPFVDRRDDTKKLVTKEEAESLSSHLSDNLVCLAEIGS